MPCPSSCSLARICMVLLYEKRSPPCRLLCRPAALAHKGNLARTSTSAASLPVWAGMSCRPVAELLKLARDVPLTVVPVRPIKQQPEVEAELPQLPELPASAPLRSAPEPDEAHAEQVSADADLPGTPDAHLSRVRHCQTSLLCATHCCRWALGHLPPWQVGALFSLTKLLGP